LGYVKLGEIRSEKPIMESRARVLAVDDDDIVLRCYRRVLAGANFSVMGARSADEALEILSHQSFDVVILESQMPGSDGLALLVAIKKICPDSEVVVITRSSSWENAKEAIRRGACEYLAKPVPGDEICRTVARAALQKKWALRRIT